MKQHRNLALGLALAAYFLAFFHRVAPAALADDLGAAFHMDAAELGLLAATYFIIYTLMQIPAGILADTLGPRRTLFIGGLVAGIGSLLFGLAADFTAAFSGRALVGLGVSVVFIAMLKIVALWFEARRFATLAGLCTLLGNCGAIAAGAPLAWLMLHTSWRAVFIGAGLLSLLIGTLCLLYIKEPPHSTPARMGRMDRTAALSGLQQVLGNRATWPGFFVNCGMAASFFSFAGLWAGPYFTQALGMTREQAAAHVSLYFIGYALGALLLGTLSDRLGRRKPLIVGGSLLHLAGWLVWLYAPPSSSGWSQLLCVAMGFFTASYTLTWACAKEVNPPLLSGMATSVVNVGVFLGPALLQPLTGWALDQHWQLSQGITLNGMRVYTAADFRIGLWLMAAAAALGCLATHWLHDTRHHIPKESPA
ncbi:MAG: MFS transporter [Sterolibacterium sp.]|jgi:MFS family permease|nr:MFS transporter [Sterolibacterium sp.]